MQTLPAQTLCRVGLLNRGSVAPAHVALQAWFGMAQVVSPFLLGADPIELGVVPFSRGWVELPSFCAVMEGDLPPD
jgi:hypothetical protein